MNVDDALEDLNVDIPVEEIADVIADLEDGLTTDDVLEQLEDAGVDTEALDDVEDITDVIDDVEEIFE